MCFRSVYRMLTALVVLASMATVVAPHALGQTCCTKDLPTSEATQYAGCIEGYKYAECSENSTDFGGLYEQTLYGPISYSGKSVEEVAGGDSGENSCYFPGDLPGQHPTIFGPGGTSWPVSTSDQWGTDFVGAWILDAQQVWELHEEGEMTLPCDEITYQTMKWVCDEQAYTYEENILQERIMNTNYTITTKRETVPSPELPVPPQ